MQTGLQFPEFPIYLDKVFRNQDYFMDYDEKQIDLFIQTFINYQQVLFDHYYCYNCLAPLGKDSPDGMTVGNLFGLYYSKRDRR